jgi:NAD(P)-dependent dehydrogenase (short-subunit alcohol dehydrogenase family)
VSTIVVTGSASGIGAVVRLRFEKEGDTVIGVDIKDAEIIADLSTKTGREAAIAGVKQHCGDSIDRFIACAGLATYARPLSLIPSVNYFGAIDLLDGLFELLKQSRDPAAVVILSNAALWMPPDESPYVQALLNHDEDEAWRILTEFEEADGILLASGQAYMGSKFALGIALRHRALNWGKLGVRLNGVAPGNTDTPMLHKVLEDPNTGDGVRSMEIPLNRFGKPEEIAAVVHFLCSPEASYVHGSIIAADGGIDAVIRPDSL